MSTLESTKNIQNTLELQKVEEKLEKLYQKWSSAITKSQRQYYEEKDYPPLIQQKLSLLKKLEEVKQTHCGVCGQYLKLPRIPFELQSGTFPSGGVVIGIE